MPPYKLKHKVSLAANPTLGLAIGHGRQADWTTLVVHFQGGSGHADTLSSVHAGSVSSGADCC